MAEYTIKNPEKIEKEQVATLKFPKTEVLNSKDEIKLRAVALQQAIRLGNTSKGKVKITFEDDNSIKRIETTIWAVTEENILLKAGVFIPIRRIHTISPY
jgi:hypothetical protein